MSTRTSCELCRGEHAIVEHRVCALDLCDECFRGDLREPMAARGFEITERHWTKKSQREGGVDTHHREVIGVAPVHLEANAAFSREGLGTRISKFFGGNRDEVQAGDSLFDDAILVDTDTPDATRFMLQQEGLQMLILEAVAEMGSIGFKSIPSGTQVRVHTIFSSQTLGEPVTGHQRTIAIALHHLETVLPKG